MIKENETEHTQIHKQIIPVERVKKKKTLFYLILNVIIILKKNDQMILFVIWKLQSIHVALKLINPYVCMVHSWS